MLFRSCVQRKSLILKFPNEEQVPKELIHHFIRGYFDGDGTAYFYKRIINNKEYIEYCLGFISSISFINSLQNYINIGSSSIINNGKNSSLYVKDKKSVKFLIDFLYKDATIYLERKRKKVEEISKLLESKKFFYSNESINQFSKEGKLIRKWKNIEEIKLKTNYNTQTILRNIKGKLKTSNKYIWQLTT